MKRLSVIWVAGLAAFGLPQDFANKPLDLNGDNGPFSELNQQQVCDEFTSAISGQVAHVTLWGNGYFQGDPFNTGDLLDFRLRMYADVSGGPWIESFFDVWTELRITDTGINHENGDRIYRFDANIAGPTLTMGTVYYFEALEADPSTPNGSFRWNNSAVDSSPQYVRYSELDPWSANYDISRRNRAFVLSPVPEPATVAILGIGVSALMMRRSRRH